MKKWAISALVYLLVVIGAYYTYSAITGTSIEDSNHHEMK